MSRVSYRTIGPLVSHFVVYDECSCKDYFFYVVYYSHNVQVIDVHFSHIIILVFTLSIQTTELLTMIVLGPVVQNLMKTLAIMTLKFLS